LRGYGKGDGQMTKRGRVQYYEGEKQKKATTKNKLWEGRKSIHLEEERGENWGGSSKLQRKGGPKKRGWKAAQHGGGGEGELSLFT